MTSVTLARGAVEVRIHRVVGAPPGSAVRQSGWATNSPMVSELRPLHGFDREVTSVAAGSTAYTDRCHMPVVTGTVDAGETDGLFVCLARLAGEATAEPLDADVRTEGGAGIRIAWPEGDVQHVVLDRDGVTVTAPAEEGSAGH